MVVAAPSRDEMVNVEVEETRLMNKVKNTVTIVRFSRGRMGGLYLMQTHAYRREAL